MNFPVALASSSSNLVISDRLNNRVLIFNSIPSGFYPAANLVLGQNDFSVNASDNGNVSLSTLNHPERVVIVDNKLVVADMSNHRVLIWNTVPNSNGQAADLILGQNSENGEGTNNFYLSATKDEHLSIAREGDKFLTGGYYSNRILIWNELPTSPEQEADIVLGQVSMTNTSPNAGGAIAANTLNKLGQIIVHDGKLIAADSANHRILIWNSIPTADNIPADTVIGQANFTSGSANRGGAVSSLSLNSPWGLFAIENKLIVCDLGNSRILIYNTIPTTANAAADLVLGQPDFSSSSANRGGLPASNTLNKCESVWSDGEKFAVSDYFNHRVLLWNSFPTSNGQSADVVLGQEDFVANLANRGNKLPNAGTFFTPTSILWIKNRLFIADRHNSRILFWNSWPSNDGQSADGVIGQPNFLEWDFRVGPERFAEIINVIEYDGVFYVSDRFNYRIVGLPVP